MACTCDGYPEPEPDLHNGPVAEALCEIMQVHGARGDIAEAYGGGGHAHASGFKVPRDHELATA